MNDAFVAAVIDAWNNPGPHPRWHHEAQRNLLTAWPTLGYAVKALAERGRTVSRHYAAGDVICYDRGSRWLKLDRAASAEDVLVMLYAIDRAGLSPIDVVAMTIMDSERVIVEYLERDDNGRVVLADGTQVIDVCWTWEGQ
jgi:hypothetical protein